MSENKLPSLKGLAALVVVFAVVTASGFGSYFATSSRSEQPISSSSQSGPYALTLVEVMQNMWNSSGVMQPKFFVLGNHGLESSANLSLPAHRLIQLTIVSYDTPTPGSTDAQGVVSGTQGGTVFLLNGSIASGMANVTMANAADWGKNVTSMPGKALVGTVTIPQLGINIPFISGSTVIADFEINQTGSFTWLCLTPCGLGADGSKGAMSTPGWMMGNLVVS